MKSRKKGNRRIVRQLRRLEKGRDQAKADKEEYIEDVFEMGLRAQKAEINTAKRENREVRPVKAWEYADENGGGILWM